MENSSSKTISGFIPDMLSYDAYIERTLSTYVCVGYLLMCVTVLPSLPITKDHHHHYHHALQHRPLPPLISYTGEACSYTWGDYRTSHAITPVFIVIWSSEWGGRIYGCIHDYYYLYTPPSVSLGGGNSLIGYSCTQHAPLATPLHELYVEAWTCSLAEEQW